METAIPPAVQPLLEAYLKGLEPWQSHFYGIYIYGSIALDAFEEGQSDIDILALTQGEWTPPELDQLEALHRELNRKYPLGKRLEVGYVPFARVGKDNNRNTLYPCVRDGKFTAAGQGDLNAVTWWLLRHKGIRLLGPERNALSLAVEWQDVLETMHYNLEGYWAGKTRRPYLFLFDYWIVFAVTTLCRILTAIEEGEIISKSAALMRWRERLPPRFQPLIDEASRLRHRLPAPSPYRSRLKRMGETLAFIKYMRERGAEVIA